MYPRYEFFQEIVKVFKDSGRSVPVFNDKHLSWKWEWAKEMYDTARRMGFPLMAGRACRLPGGRLRSKCRSARGFGRPCASATAAWTATTSTASRRCNAWWSGGAAARPGSSGCRPIAATHSGRPTRTGVWSKDLVDAALCRSHTLKPARAGFNDIFPGADEMRALVKDPVAYAYEHQDGLKCTMLLMSGLVEDFNFAAHVDGQAGRVLDPDVPADAAGAHQPGELLQPAREQRRADVPDRQGNLSAGAHAADHRADGRRRGEPLPRAGALRHAAPGDHAINPRRRRPSGGRSA